jgi:hypothetical protein
MSLNLKMTSLGQHTTVLFDICSFGFNCAELPDTTQLKSCEGHCENDVSSVGISLG